MKPKKEIDIIREECEANGLKIREVFRRAQIPESTIQNWERKEPDAFTTKHKIHCTIQEMKLEKESQTA